VLCWSQIMAHYVAQADRVCMDYEARMHSLLKSSLQEERARAAKQAESSTAEQACKELELSSGLQQSMARNYRMRKNHNDEMNNMLSAVERARATSASELSECQEALRQAESRVADLSAELSKTAANLETSLSHQKELEAQLGAAATEAHNTRCAHAEEVESMSSRIDSLTAQLSSSNAQILALKNQEHPAAPAPAAPQTEVVHTGITENDLQEALERQAYKHRAQMEELERECNKKVEEVQAAYSSKLEDAEYTLSKEKDLTAELNSQLRSFKLEADVQAQSARNAQAMARMEAAGIEKREDYRNLQRIQAEAQVEVLTKESETMRRVFESSLTEGTHFNTMLKEQLDIVRDTMAEQATAAKQEIDTLAFSVEDMKRRRNQLELDKFKSESELEQRIADIHTKAEDTQLEKETTTAELVETQATVDRLREALAVSVKESDHLSAELDKADRKCDLIQSETEAKIQSIMREKQVLIQQAQEETNLAKKQVSVARMSQQDAENKAQQASIQVTRVKHELGTVLHQNQQLLREQEKADILMGVMSSQMSEVKAHQEDLSDGFAHQVARVANRSN